VGASLPGRTELLEALLLDCVAEGRVCVNCIARQGITSTYTRSHQISPAIQENQAHFEMVKDSSKVKGCVVIISRARVCPAVQQKGYYSSVAMMRCTHQRVPAVIIPSIDDSSKIKEAPS
jgi:hypothetical protein